MGNLLLGKKNTLQNRQMHVQYIDTVNTQNDPVKVSVLQQLQQKPNANYSELAAKAWYSVATIKRHIQELKKSGLIERIGSDKNRYWKTL